MKTPPKLLRETQGRNIYIFYLGHLFLPLNKVRIFSNISTNQYMNNIYKWYRNKWGCPQAQSYVKVSEYFVGWIENVVPLYQQ